MLYIIRQIERILTPFSSQSKENVVRVSEKLILLWKYPLIQLSDEVVVSFLQCVVHLKKTKTR